MKYPIWQMIFGAIRRPSLAFRFLQGKSPSDFDDDEIVAITGQGVLSIVEAGAFDGKDSVRFASLWPLSEIYAFEPIPSLAQKVKQNTRDYPNIRVIEKALIGNSNKVSVLHTFSDSSAAHGSSSLLPPEDHLKVAPEVKFNETTSVDCITLDSWYQASGLGTIDLLWLDVQGAELEVLRAGKIALDNTQVCHLEVSRKSLYLNGATFKDVKLFMKQMGFDVVAARIPVRSGNAIFKKIP
jgi:FkbM family methyltransferase